MVVSFALAAYGYVLGLAASTCDTCGDNDATAGTVLLVVGAVAPLALLVEWVAAGLRRAARRAAARDRWGGT